MMYSFFGQNIAVNLCNSGYKNTLLTELKPYQTNNQKPTITITDDWSDFNFKPIANNPKQHLYYQNVIHIKEKLTEVAFVFNGQAEVVTVYFKLITAPNTFRKIIRKWLNMQFTNRTENIGQIFHENVLIPLSFFIKDVAPIHASGFKYKQKTYLLGGTGGVGKTTLEILFCQHKNASFITDDIAVISDNGAVFPNYNYPKIYAYNLVGNQELKKKLFNKTSFLNKIHWFLHKKIFGLSKVRRKITPFNLYKNLALKPEKLTDYLILFKTKTNAIELENCKTKNAIEATIKVIQTEYAYFFNHLHWHEFNAISLNQKPIITLSELQEKWKITLNNAFKNSNNKIVKIPFDINHQDFQKQMSELINQTHL